MTRYTDEQIAAAARAVDEVRGRYWICRVIGSSLRCVMDREKGAHVPGTHGNVPKCQAWMNAETARAALDTLPAHTAELVEALAVFLDDPAIHVSLGGNPVYADQRLGFANKVYSEARAQIKGRAS